MTQHGSSTTLTRSTIQRELQRVRRAGELARFLGEMQNEDWLYGAETALSWVLREDTMAPTKAFGIREEVARRAAE
jgi:hypothetical protein